MAVLEGDSSNNIIYGTFWDDYIDGKGGNDILFGGASSDYVFGRTGNDWLFGGDGGDEINGHQGNDLLVGGIGADKFSFDPNSGNDIIWDFEKGRDKIDIDPTIYGDVNDILNNITYQNGNATIDLGNGNSIAVRGVAPNSLDANDFVQHTVIDFEDLDSTSFGVALPDGYQGFNWNLDDGSNIFHQNDPGAGYGIMGTNLTYNAGGESAVTITRVGGGAFDFEGVDLISAIAPAQDVIIIGFGGTIGGLPLPVGIETFSITNTEVTEVDVDWGLIDRLVIAPQLDTGNYIAMDNFDFVL